MRECPACAEPNPERARFCLACGHPLPDGDAPRATELRRTVSVVFADLAGSTVLGESLDAEPLRYVTGRFFDVMRGAVEKHEGTVEKFIGDAVVAVFGVPRVREDDALRAVRAAEEMRRALPALNNELERDFNVRLQIRIGVNTGEVVVGEGRAGGSFATGDAVNVAARLEQSAQPGEVLIGDATHRLVREFVEAVRVDPLALKGKADAVNAWRLLAIGSGSRRAPGATVFVGRDPQLRLLADSFRRATEERACQLVTVLAAAGMGKSRLAEEFAGALDPDDTTVLFGHCLSYGQGATYWPLREAILAAAGLTGDESTQEAAAGLRDILGDRPDTDNVIRRLLALIGHHKDDPVPEDMSWAVRTFLETLARRRPVVLVVDDLHWAEPGMLDLVEHIADWSREVPLMLLVLARPEFLDNRPTWSGGKLNATSMLLSPLDESAAAGLIQKHDLPPEVQRRVVEAAGGNPLFAEQLVAMLVDQGHADIRDGIVSWRQDAAADVTLTLPPSVSALLTARIDRLAADERLVLGCASVVGAIFYVEAVAALIDAPADRVVALLDGLVRRELLRPAASDVAGLTAYRFLHALVRDAAYEGLAKQARAEWHERLADWLTALPADVVPDEIIGHHLASAWDYRQQIGPPTEHSRALARRAAERLAAGAGQLELTDVNAAAALNERAVSMLSADDPLRGECMLALGQQRLDLGEVSVARQILSAVATSSEPRQAELAKVMLCRVNGFTTDARVQDADRVVREALDRFTGLDDRRGLAWTHLAMAELASFRGRFGDALPNLTLSLDHGSAIGDAGCVVRARGLIGIFHLFGPTPAEQVIAALDALLAGSDNDPRVRAEVEQVNCVMHAMCGRFERARAMAADCRHHLAEVGHGLFLANLAQSTGHLEELAGDLDAAEREYAQSTSDLTRLGESAYLSTVAGLHARLLTRRGKQEPALRAVDLARLHGSADDVTTQSLVMQVDSLMAAAEGDPGRARRNYGFLEMEDPQDTPDAAGEAYRTAADVEKLLGDVDAERQHLQSALRAFETKGNVVRAEEMRERLAVS